MSHASPPPDSASTPPSADVERHINKMLEISTAHLPQAFMARLEETAGADYPFSSFLNEYGSMMLSLPDEQEWPFFCEVLGDSPLADPRFLVVIDYARNLGCSWLLVDRDVPPLSDLPVYEWE